MKNFLIKTIICGNTAKILSSEVVMKIFALILLVAALMGKIALYLYEFMKRDSYTSDTEYNAVWLTIISSVIMYAGYYYLIQGVYVGYFITLAVAVGVFASGITVTCLRKWRTFHIHTGDGYVSYLIVNTALARVKKLGRYVIHDDDIAINKHIRVTFAKDVVSCRDMAKTVRGICLEKGAKGNIGEIILLMSLIHAVEVILDVSFFINIYTM